MADIVDAATRSRMMSGIRGKNTRPEMRIRSLLHAAGFRFRLHDRRFSGKPDLVLPKYRTAVFVHGCFWHGHSDCKLFRLPSSRQEFWRDKISSNVSRDERNRSALLQSGWKVAIVWECSGKGSRKLPDEEVLARLAEHIRYGNGTIDIRGRELPTC